MGKGPGEILVDIISWVTRRCSNYPKQTSKEGDGHLARCVGCSMTQEYPARVVSCYLIPMRTFEGGAKRILRTGSDTAGP